MGSPPRGRGKANWHCVRRPALRITPAQAGKRTRSWRAYGCPWDHPRVGGEKKGVRHWWALPRGSPPRGRGKVSRGRGKLKNVGITPAWAGKRSWAYINGILARDHPRVGGEKFFKTIIFGCSLGSPPRGRGKDPAHQRGRHRPGITPAWAGKRAILAGRKAQVEDHPRVGGEKTGNLPHQRGAGGSPPRGRGKDPSRAERGRHWGITPAWAGKSFLIR